MPKEKRTHVYHNLDGTKAYKKEIGPDGAYISRWENGKWIPGLNGRDHLLYNLPGVCKSSIIAFCEGEKDAETLIKLGYSGATTLDSGSHSPWRKEYDEFFQDKKVLLFFDDDGPGRKFRDRLIKCLTPLATELKVIDLFSHDLMTDEPRDQGYDVSDFVRQLGGDRLKDLIRKTETWTPGQTFPNDPKPEQVKEEPIPAAVDESEPEPDETVDPWPEDDNAMYHGPLREYLLLVDPVCEADLVGVLLQSLIVFGNMIGRGPRVHYSNFGSQHTNLNCVLVGGTSSGRKGVSWYFARKLFEAVDPYYCKENLKSGVCSGQGLGYHLRDAVEKKKIERDRYGNAVDEKTEIIDEGVTDKRLTAVEDEFASVLKLMGLDKSILADTIRTLFGSGNINNLSKNSPYKATGAHFSLIGHITPEELEKLLLDVDSFNGFSNRFIWILVRRTKLVALADPLDEVRFAKVVKIVREALDHAKTITDIKLNPEATERYIHLYKTHFNEPRPGVFGATVKRGAPITLRLAAIYSMLDRCSSIELVHLNAAFALWKYAEDSARLIFGDATGNQTADMIRATLQEKPEGMTRTEIRDLFQRNKTKKQINSAINKLLEFDLIQKTTAKRSDGKVGKPRTIFLSA